MATPMGRNAARFARKLQKDAHEVLLREAIKQSSFAAALEAAGGRTFREDLPKRKS